jgi:hypothetical protein
MSVGDHRWKQTRTGKTWWREIPNPAAVQHVYNSAFSGGVRFTYFALALEMPARRFETPPMFVDPLLWWTHYTDRMTREHLDRLEDAGEIARNRAHPNSKRVRYEMVKLPGPLWANLGNRNAEKISGSDFGNPEIASGSIRKGFPDPSASTPYVRTLTTTTPSEEQEKKHSVVAAYLSWLKSQYPQHNAGALYRGGNDDHRKITALLDSGYNVERLKEMALAMWTITPDGQERSDLTWIATRPVRGVALLHHKIDFLDRYTRGLKTATAAADSDAERDARRAKTKELLAEAYAYERAAR